MARQVKYQHTMADPTSPSDDQKAELSNQPTPFNIRDIDTNEVIAGWNQQQNQHKDKIREAAEKVAVDIEQAGINACAAINRAGKAQELLLKKKVDSLRTDAAAATAQARAIMSDNAGVNDADTKLQGEWPAL